MMIVLYILIGLLALIIILGLVAPKNYEANRSIIIQRPIAEVFQYLKFLKNQDEWSPWKKKDPDMEQYYKGTDGELGFVAGWKGNKDVGEGEQELINIVENVAIDSQLRFFKPWKSQSIGHFVTDKVDEDKTMVTWGFSGRNPFPFNIFMLFFNFEKAVGKDFEEGLESLKNVLEKK